MVDEPSKDYLPLYGSLQSFFVVFRFLSVLLVLASIPSVLPLAQLGAELPPSVSHIALDEQTGQFLAFRSNGSLFGNFSVADRQGYSELYARSNSTSPSTNSTGCTNLTAAAVQQLPGWNQLNQAVTNEMGTGSHRIVTNPPEYPSQGAVTCTPTSPVPVTLDGTPSCKTLTQRTDGQLANATGMVRLTTAQGYTNTAVWTVQTDSAISVTTSVSWTISFDIPPLLFAIGGSTSVSTSFMNTQSYQFTTIVDQTNTQEVVMNTLSGMTCSLQVSIQDCVVGGKATIPFVASGFVWYYFDSATAPKSGGPKHYKWGFRIEDYIKNVTDRSTFSTVTGNTNGTLYASYVGICS